MRKLLTTVATALTLGALGVAAPAMADAPQATGYNQTFGGPKGPQAQFDKNGSFGEKFDERRFGDRDFDDRRFGDKGFDDHRFDRDGRFSITFDFGRHGGQFDRWERGWGDTGYGDHHFHKPMSY